MNERTIIGVREYLMTHPEEMTVNEAAEQLGVHPQTVRTWIKVGKLTESGSIKAQRGLAQFVRREDVERLLGPRSTGLVFGAKIDGASIAGMALDEFLRKIEGHHTVSDINVSRRENLFTPKELMALVREQNYRATVTIDIGQDGEEKYAAHVGYFVEIPGGAVFACKWVDDEELFPLLGKGGSFQYGGKPCKVPKP